MEKTTVGILAAGIITGLILSAGCSSDSAVRHNVTITSDTIQPWTAGQSGAFRLEAKNGIPPYYWSVQKGSSLPGGFSLSSAGIITGNALPLPETVPFIVTSSFIVVVSDSGPPASYDEKTYTITIKNQLTPTPTSCAGQNNDGHCCPEGNPYYYDGKCHQCSQGYHMYDTSAGHCFKEGYPIAHSLRPLIKFPFSRRVTEPTFN